MVAHPAEYPWSSYQYNAVGKPISLIEPNSCYLSLGKTKLESKIAYRAPFEQGIPDYTLQEIRDYINKAWVLGSDGFKKQIEAQTGRRTSPSLRGDDKKSEKYKARTASQ